MKLYWRSPEGYEIDEALVVHVLFRDRLGANLATIARKLADVCISPEFNCVFRGVIRSVSARYEQLLK
jgi:hypothetical protein